MRLPRKPQGIHRREPQIKIVACFEPYFPFLLRTGGAATFLYLMFADHVESWHKFVGARFGYIFAGDGGGQTIDEQC